MQLDDGRLELGRAPIPGSAAAGQDVRYEPEFEALEDQIRRMESAGADGVDWRRVAEQSQIILREKSKDLLVAAYYAFALWRLEQMRGAAVGLIILHDLVANFWDALYPPQRRTRARIGVFEWLAERLTGALAQRSEDLSPSPEAGVALEALQGLSELLEARLGPNQASLGELIRKLRPLAEQATAAETEAPPTPATPPAPAPGNGVSAPLPVPVPPSPTMREAVPEDLDHAVDVLREWQRQVGLAMLARDATDARAYALLALAAWLPVTTLPPAQAGRTALPPPPAERLRDLAARQGGEPAAFIAELQSFCAGPGLFWLNGQRKTAEALQRLGDPAEAARQAHAAAVALALRRLPGLETLAFSDGTPFADLETQQWLQNLEEGASRQDARPVPAAVANGADLAHAASEARDLLSSGRTDEAVVRLAAGVKEAKTGAERLRWLLEELRLCLEIPDLVVGMGLARGITALVESHRLEDWDPELAAEAFQLAYQCAAHQEATSVVTPEERGALLRQWMTHLVGLDAGRGRAAIHLQQAL
jgi:type VI secretion system protein VasJ